VPENQSGTGLFLHAEKIELLPFAMIASLCFFQRCSIIELFLREKRDRINSLSCAFPSWPFQYAPATLINLTLEFVSSKNVRPAAKSMNFPCVNETIGSSLFFHQLAFENLIVFLYSSIASAFGKSFRSFGNPAPQARASLFDFFQIFRSERLLAQNS